MIRKALLRCEKTYLLEVDGPDELLALGVLDVHLEASVGLY